MPRQGLCEIVVVMDRSGSMENIKGDMMGGFDQFMEDQKKVPGECRVSLFQFDGDYESVYEGRPVAEVPKCSLVPRGSTALVDAVGKTINAVGERFAKMDDGARPEKVALLIITDGHENASREFTTAQVRKMIEHQRNAYRWQFVYLGADAGAFDEAAKLGTSGVQYAATATGAKAMYHGTSAAVMDWRGASATANLNIPATLLPDDEEAKP